MQPVTLNSKVWEKAEIIRRLDERSHLIDNGRRLLRRNRVDLMRVPRSTPEYQQSIDEQQTRERGYYPDPPTADEEQKTQCDGDNIKQTTPGTPRVIKDPELVENTNGQDQGAPTTTT
ncbi:hypothetical protein LSAT2_010624 [Lamellibrachia satsuma]|nr:hypothetical protein LSAT2_010624 [Lamellibrachia satsuma]